MTDITKFARPYAQAAFEYAFEHKQLPQWSNNLKNLAQLASHSDVRKILRNPNVEPKQRLEIFLSLKDLAEEVRNFLQLLTEHQRLILLPEIARLFVEYREASEKIQDVEVSSVIRVDEDEQKKLIQALEKKLRRKIILQFKIDPELIGGVKVRAGDLVFDGSVRGELNRMRQNLIE